MTEQEMKDWIDNASYEQLLTKIRFAPPGDPYFVGDIGDYFTKACAAKREEVGSAEHTRASKAIGWEA